jgi:hypothetical protein
MAILTKILLAISSVASVAGGILDFGRFKINPSLTIMLPMGAVFFGMFLISFMMEKEMTKFDEENILKYERIRRTDARNSNCRNCKNCECRTRKHHKTETGETTRRENLSKRRLQKTTGNFSHQSIIQLLKVASGRHDN